jgi:hypothetical protein
MSISLAVALPAMRGFIDPIAYKKWESLNIFTAHNITNIISNIVK